MKNKITVTVGVLAGGIVISLLTKPRPGWLRWATSSRMIKVAVKAAAETEVLAVTAAKVGLD